MEHGERFEQFVREAAQNEAVRYEEDVYSICSRCESPIEALVMAALHKHAKIGCENFHFLNTDKPNPVPAFDEAAFVYTQVRVGEYRADILIHDVTMPLELREPQWIIVECDGHEYHERTKEQARRDKKRDRFFTAKGFKVLRFTGSEIWADPDSCAEEIAENLASNDWMRVRDK
jgi:very-short-patch-repair endonuclease